MHVEFPCPVCERETWSRVGSHYYWRAEHEEFGNWFASRHVRLRRQVLFDLWFPEADCVSLSSLRCDHCGLICYSPRPNDFDIEAKYHYLAQAEKVEMADVDASRAAQIFKSISAIKEAPTLVLDVGGGDGRMMLPFLARGARCFVVDYMKRPHAGIERLGSTLSEVSGAWTFDAIICSHVLEHVASPRRLLDAIVERMLDGSILYVEVPREIFRSNVLNPIQAEPVTHINFFTADSLQHLLHVAGFRIITLEVCEGSYEGRPLPVVRTVAAKVKSAVSSNII